MKVFTLSTLFTLSCLSISSFAASAWDYSKQQDWGSVCSMGKQQSPINIIHPKPVTNHKLYFHYHDVPFIAGKLGADNLDNDVIHDKTDYLTFDQEKYIFEGFHFHTQSEHTIDGKKYAGELHFIHGDQQHHYVVIGIFIKEGQENKHLDQILQISNAAKSKHINPQDFLPNKLDYFTYAGSLTTPPCSENVTWIVMQEPIEVSKQQLKELQSNILHYDARNLQLLNGRIIEKSKAS